MLRIDPHKYSEPILLAVSGGVDSMVMAELFRRKFLALRGSVGCLAIAHCNFHLRGEESDSDEKFVRNWAQQHSIRCLVKHFDTAAFAGSQGISLEMAARQLRYSWFDGLCSEYGFQGVCVAHNANDNAETLLLNLLRGTGLKGLCAMSESAPNPYGSSLVLRPLLEFTREQIETYAREHSLQWRTDSTNLENDARRNIIRNKVFPVLKEINPSFVSTISKDIGNLRQARDIVETFARSHDIFDGKGRIDTQRLLSLPHWEFLLHRGLSELDFSSSVISDLSELLRSGRIISGKTFRGAGGRVAVTTTTHIIIEDPSGSDEPQVEIELLRGPFCATDVKTPRGTILIDAAAVPGAAAPLMRKWSSGDWLIPVGMKGKKKVSDLLTDLKYDILRKERVLVVEGEGSHVLAVVGERIDDSVKITPSTTKAWRIRIRDDNYSPRQ